MRIRSAHTYIIGIVTAFVLTALCGPVLAAQELVMPPEWEKPLHEVRPLYSQDTLTICFLGDIMMHSMQIDNALKEDGSHDFSSYFRFIEEDIAGADLAVANMEFTLAGEPYTGYPQFSAPDAIAGYVASCGFDILLAANNHIYDRGSEGAMRTVGIYRKLRKQHGILLTGIAEDARALEENCPLMIRRKGIQLAMVNFTYGTNLGADRQWPKVNYLNDRQMLEKAMEKAQAADFTIALPHWGTEYQLIHSASQEETARWLAGKGADVIIGTHPHVPQDMELMEISGREPVPVAYSLGNAVSNMSAANTQMELMATLKIVIGSDGDMRMLPLEFTYLWCSRPGGYCSSYTVIPVEKFAARKDEWLGVWDHDKMMTTYERVRRLTGIEDKTTYDE